jgi:hypothetical protein
MLWLAVGAAPARVSLSWLLVAPGLIAVTARLAPATTLQG